MDTIISTLFGSLLVYGYLNLICRYIKLFKDNKRAKARRKDKNNVNLLFVFILMYLAFKIIREIGNSSFALWCAIFVFEAIYIVLISLNSKYVYFCSNSIIFPDCAKKLKDYSYKINDDILKILPDKPPRKIESFYIEDNKDVLIDILKNYKMFE